MSLLVTDAIVLHSADYLESSRIFRLATREAGVQSVLARGARSSEALRQRAGRLRGQLRSNQAWRDRTGCSRSTCEVRPASCGPRSVHRAMRCECVLLIGHD